MPKFYRRVCDFCEEPYKGRGKQFCSPKCQNNWQRQKGANFNVAALRKRELIAFNTKECRHGKLYNQHPRCFKEEYLDAERNRIGFLDIETFTSGFVANRGIILSYAIKDKDSKKIYSSIITKKELFSKTKDKGITQRLINDIERFDTLIGYYSTGFDIPTIRTRALYWKLKHPFFGYIQHKDVFYMVRAKLNIKPNSQEEACRIVLGKTRKTHYNFNRWMEALQGNQKALNDVLVHNKADVLDLEDLYNVMIDYVKSGTKSI